MPIHSSGGGDGSGAWRGPYLRADKGIQSHRWGWLKDTDQSISEGALFRFISRFGSHLGGLLVELAEELDPWAVVCPYARSFAPRLIAIRSSWFNMLKAFTTAQSSASSASLFNSTTTVLQACPMSGLPTWKHPFERPQGSNLFIGESYRLLVP